MFESCGAHKQGNDNSDIYYNCNNRNDNNYDNDNNKNINNAKYNNRNSNNDNYDIDDLHVQQKTIINYRISHNILEVFSALVRV